MVKGWIKHVAVAVCYALLYTVLRPISGGLFAVSTGFRFSVLLFVPYTYWPALLVGEVVPLSLVNMRCISQFGSEWVALSSIPPMLFAMPMIYWFREHGLFPSRKTVNLKQLLLCIASVSVLWVVITFLFNLTAKEQPPFAPWKMLLAALLGRYVGILAVLPLSLMVWVAYRSNKLHLVNVKEFLYSRLFLETVLFVLPIIICMGELIRHASPDFLLVLQVLIFIPVSVFTIRHGWRGSAVGVALVMTCIFINTNHTVDFIPLQAIIGFASTVFLALGASVTTQQEISEKERLSSLEATKVAQQGLYLSELRLKQISYALELIGANLNLTQNRLMSKYKHVMPFTESQMLHKQTSEAKDQIYKLANSIHPVDWKEKGLPYVLQQTIARILDASGINYKCLLTGVLSDLSTHLHVAVYRLINEAIVHVCSQENCNYIELTLRGGFTNGQRWILMRVHGTCSNVEHANDPVYKRDDLTRKLGAHGLSVLAMRDQARLYDGDLHVKNYNENVVLTVLLHDHTATQKKRKHSHVSVSKSATGKKLLLR